jgi:hypothetical protein
VERKLSLVVGNSVGKARVADEPSGGVRQGSGTWIFAGISNQFWSKPLLGRCRAVVPLLNHYPAFITFELGVRAKWLQTSTVWVQWLVRFET